MKRIVSLLAASLLISTSISGAALAQNGNGNGNGNGGGNAGMSDSAPGQQKSEGESARDHAPGQQKEDGESARDYAPGQQNSGGGVDEGTTGSVGGRDFGSAMSLIRSGMDVDSFPEDADVTVVELSDLTEGQRQALQRAIEANEDEIGELRDYLAGLDTDEIDDLDSVVAADLGSDGTITVYVE
ncbi:hypothetical protein [Chelativorans sp.]|uniref:hypothetical protein n=1 Tax=Chelativorans sp. TaxID=2203393 RepID=UPI002812138B|nr:hypothetical protein [Chelativorans sp.]